MTSSDTFKARMMNKLRSGRKWLKGIFTRKTAEAPPPEKKIVIGPPTNFRHCTEISLGIDHEGNAMFVPNPIQGSPPATTTETDEEPPHAI